ncbi:MAG TPA: hypothetical protein VFI13_11240 [Gemmatimonadales bacterium]|nr:hypothetical protein [Gemmatimonadales bacterium]
MTRDASVQFGNPMRFRVIRVLDWPTYTGWVWLDGYQLNADGEAVDRRSIFVQVDGLHYAPQDRAEPGRRGRGAGPVIAPPRRPARP